MEAHCGFRMTTELVNEHRRQQGDGEVSRFAIMSEFYRLKPTIDILEKIQSGGNKPDWIEARFNLTKQMEIMLGNLTLQEILTDNEGNLTYVPPLPWYDPNNLPNIFRNMIAWWDECHIDQQGGKVGNRPFQYSFKRDYNGKLSDNGAVTP